MKGKNIEDSELWNLDATIAKFIVPRLKKFKEEDQKSECGFCDFSKIKRCIILNKIIFSFNYCIQWNANSGKCFEKYKTDPKLQSKLDEGLQLFAKYYDHLWS